MSIKSMLKKSRATYLAASWALECSFPAIRCALRLMNRLHGIDPNTVYFSSFNGGLYNDNPRAVAEALHALAPGARIVFRLNARGMADPRVPDYVVKVPKYSLRALREMATARVLVKNAGMRRWMLKFPGQFYIQTWHGDRGFKRIRLDLGESADHRREAKWLDLMTSGSDFGSRVNRSAFGYEGENLECGCPRNDLLLRDAGDLPDRLRARLGIPEDVRVLMYAPTFRDADSGAGRRAPLSLRAVRETLERATGERWFCLTRSHELDRGVVSDADMDVSDWPETNELLLITDLLITDYSSIGGDFVLLGRPVIFYQPDRSAYDGDRGMYIDPDNAPLIVAHDEAELLSILSGPIDAGANCRDYLAFFGAHETGHAAEAVARRIVEVLGIEGRG